MSTRGNNSAHNSIVSPASSKYSNVNIPKPKIIVMDVTGVLMSKASTTFSLEVKRFMRDHAKTYVREKWTSPAVKMDIMMGHFIQNASISRPEPDAPHIHSNRRSEVSQQNSFLRHLFWRLNLTDDPHPEFMTLFHSHIIGWGTKKGLYSTPVYPEVAAVLKKWKKLGIDIYVTIGSREFLDTFLSKTTEGDLVELLSGHINLVTYDGKTAKKEFNRLKENFQTPVNQILYITRYAADARMAKKSNIPSIIIAREDFSPDLAGKKTTPSITPGSGSHKSKRKTSELKEKDDFSPTKSTDSTHSLQEASGQEEMVAPSREMSSDQVMQLGSPSKITMEDANEFTIIHQLAQLHFVDT